MRCAHCMYECTEEGEDMTEEVFKKALELSWIDGTVGIGGGEPTLHPMLFYFLELAIPSFPSNVQVVTKGKKTEEALRLHEWSCRKPFDVMLSLDKYHEKIDKRVVETYKQGRFYINPVGIGVARGYGVAK